MYNPAVIPRLTPITALLALLQAFFIAPYQHVHVGTPREKHGGRAESAPAIVHAHPYAVSIPANHNDGATAEHARKPHVSVALDTFATLAQTVTFVLIQPRSPVQIFAPAESFVRIELTESRGHDPPCIGNTAPRAPPV
jgi:hypothetical protein